MKEFTIKVNTNWETDEVLASPTGRIHVGEHVARLFFDRVNDRQIMMLPNEALTDGSVVLVDTYHLTGFGKLSEMEESK
jgi:hypothetical protein